MIPTCNTPFGRLQLGPIPKRVSPQTFRHSSASHLLLANYDNHTIQRPLGHSDVKTTMIYIQTVPSVTLKEAKSPLDPAGRCPEPLPNTPSPRPYLRSDRFGSAPRRQQQRFLPFHGLTKLYAMEDGGALLERAAYNAARGWRTKP
jgi:Phage integrase family